MQDKPPVTNSAILSKEPHLFHGAAGGMSRKADSLFCVSVSNRKRMPAFTDLIGPVAVIVLTVVDQHNSTGRNGR